MSKTFIYLAGNGGRDTFTCEKSTLVPSGVFYLEQGLETLLPLKDFEVKASSLSESDRSPRMEAELKRFESEKKIIRIYNYRSLSEESKQTFHPTPDIPDEPTQRLLIVHHAARVQDGSLAASLQKILERFTPGKDEWPGTDMPQILVNVSKYLPALSEGADKGEPFKDKMWNELYKVCDHVGIVISLSAIRSEGGSISRRLSWEQGIEDLTAELHLFPRLRGLTRFRHLFVRVGTVGFIHIEHRKPDSVEPPLEGWTYFSPYARRGIYRDHEREGHTFGGNVVLIAALVRAYHDGAFSVMKEKAERVEKLRNVFWRAARGIRKMDDEGYDAPGGDNDGVALIRSSFVHAKQFLDDNEEYSVWEQGLFSSEGAKKKSDILAWRPIPDHLMTPRPPNSIRFSDRWHILDDMLMEAPVHRINIAMAIVKAGHDRVLNRRWHKRNLNDSDPIWSVLIRPEYWNPKDHGPDFVTLAEDDMPATPAEKKNLAGTGAIMGDLENDFELNVPVMSFGKITAIEREDIEGFRNITNLLTVYVDKVMKYREDSSKWPNPISVAVFGPPGAGKTFAVKQIIKELEEGTVGEISESNVAQFRVIGEVKKAFRVVKPNGEIKKVPILFFDEFDSACDGVELGWLKAFLGPMTENRTPAILFFAGAVHHSFERFDPFTDPTYENRRDSAEFTIRADHFVKQKGPDFTSRLRGFLNILYIDDKPGRVKHFVRRALQLRGLLDTHGLVDDKKEAKIDDAIIYALLTMDSYRHGVRSMEAILEICPPIHEKIEIASLPSRSQLEMHVDADEFLIRVQRGRVRSQSDWQQTPRK